MSLSDDLKKVMGGEVDNAAETLEFYSHDASLFEVVPEAVVFPKDAADVQNLVTYVAKNKAKHPDLSITARSAGTDMSGGAINESIVADFTKHFTQIEKTTFTEAQAQPGVYYRDFEKATLEHNALMPSYPASRDLCTIGGMVNNNSGGEKSLEFGKTENFVTSLDVVLADGSAVTMGPLTKKQLAAKMKLKTFEGQIYRDVFKLVDTHYDEIKKAKPHVTVRII
jgi:FAD/FMN-containing dehydrogenase